MRAVLSSRIVSEWSQSRACNDVLLYVVPLTVWPLVHTPNEEQAAGTAFAISYNSDIKQVTPENLVVFSVLYQYVRHLKPVSRSSPQNSRSTPWKRLVEYQVPNLPACPPDGCHCVVRSSSRSMFKNGSRCVEIPPVGMGMSLTMFEIESNSRE